jgi:hypothetical protein
LESLLVDEDLYLFLKQTLITPFEPGEVINHTLDGVSGHPVTTKGTDVLRNWVDEQEGNCSGIST